MVRSGDVLTAHHTRDRSWAKVGVSMVVLCPILLVPVRNRGVTYGSSWILFTVLCAVLWALALAAYFGAVRRSTGL